jgi:hypothetical protein
LEIQNEIGIFLKIKILDFETFESKWFWNSIQNLNHDDFKNKAFGDSFQIQVSNEIKFKSDFKTKDIFQK